MSNSSRLYSTVGGLTCDHFSYGERGSDIIFKVLSRHFAVDELVWGIPMIQYVYHVLIPETAVRLIEEDLGLDDFIVADRDAAFKIKAESTEYGNLQNKLD